MTTITSKKFLSLLKTHFYELHQGSSNNPMIYDIDIICDILEDEFTYSDSSTFQEMKFLFDDETLTLSVPIIKNRLSKIKLETYNDQDLLSIILYNKILFIPRQ